MFIFKKNNKSAVLKHHSVLYTACRINIASKQHWNILSEVRSITSIFENGHRMNMNESCHVL
jgi:hypothetical protein